MADIKIVIQEAGKQPRESIHPQESLQSFQRVYKNELIDYYLVDEKGNRLEGKVEKPDPKKKAFEAMLGMAKQMKIKGYHLMSEEKLLKAIQEAHKKAETK